MSKVYQIHVDTSSTTSNTVYKYNNNPFNCSVILGNTHRRVRSISLKSAEIPISWYNVRAPYNVFSFTDSNGTQNRVLTPGTYTIGTIVSSLNGLITPSGTNPLTLNGLLVNYTNSTSSTTINAPIRSLASFIGFTDQQNGTSINATNAPVANFDNYIGIFIENIGASSLEPNVPITFKIPVPYNTSVGNIINFSAGNQWEQKIHLYDPNIRLDRLNIRVLDRFGNLLDNAGIDWSLTLEIEADT